MSFVVKMAKDIARNAIAKTNFELFCDCQTILRLTFVLPMLEIVQDCQRWARGGIQIEYLGFKFHIWMYMRHNIDVTSGEVTMVSKGNWECAMQSIKEQCISVALGLIKELDRCFSYVKPRECYWDHISPILDGT
jgi:hypothetical protein